MSSVDLRSVSAYLANSGKSTNIVNTAYFKAKAVSDSSTTLWKQLVWRYFSPFGSYREHIVGQVCGVSKMTLRNGETAFDDTCHNRSRTRERGLSSANLGNYKERFSPSMKF